MSDFTTGIKCMNCDDDLTLTVSAEFYYDTEKFSGVSDEGTINFEIEESDMIEITVNIDCDCGEGSIHKDDLDDLKAMVKGLNRSHVRTRKVVDHAGLKVTRRERGGD